MELSVRHRQKSNIQFLKILDRVAVGEISDEDFLTLSHRRLHILDKSEQDKFNKAVFIYLTNDAVANKNEECLRKLNKPVLNIRAIDSPSCTNNIDKETGLQAEFIAIGCRVMLTNTWVKGGLANGTLGTIQAVVYNEMKTTSEAPDFIMVQYDGYNGPCINANLFPVAMIIRSCEKTGRYFTRKQFPLKLAYAITIHKSQGLTLEYVVIDLGEFSAGLTYVGLSRVRRLVDLVFIRYCDKKRFDKIGKSKKYKLKIAFLKSLHKKALGNIFYFFFLMIYYVINNKQ